MPYEFACPGCHVVLSLPASTPGAVVACPKCGTQMQLPAVPVPVAQPVPAAQTPRLINLKTDDLADFRNPGFLRGQRKAGAGGGAGRLITAFAIAGVFLAIVVGIVFVNRQGGPVSVPQEKPRPVAVANAGPGEPPKNPKQWGNLRRLNNRRQREEADQVLAPAPEDPGLSGNQKVLLTLLFALYFLPTGLALLRGHQNVAAIAVLNVFLGWLGIGWIVALIWAFTAVRSREHAHYHNWGK